jgi:hypothetical protein
MIEAILRKILWKGRKSHVHGFNSRMSLESAIGSHLEISGENFRGNRSQLSYDAVSRWCDQGHGKYLENHPFAR